MTVMIVLKVTVISIKIATFFNYSNDSKRNDIDNPSNKHADDSNDIADEYIRV
jgi:hypothetical protein